MPDVNSGTVPAIIGRLATLAPGHDHIPCHRWLTETSKIISTLNIIIVKLQLVSTKNHNSWKTTLDVVDTSQVSKCDSAECRPLPRQSKCCGKWCVHSTGKNFCSVTIAKNQTRMVKNYDAWSVEEVWREQYISNMIHDDEQLHRRRRKAINTSSGVWEIILLPNKQHVKNWQEQTAGLN